MSLQAGGEAHEQKVTPRKGDTEDSRRHLPNPTPPCALQSSPGLHHWGGGLALWWCSCFWVTHTLVSNAPIKIHWFTKSDSGTVISFVCHGFPFGVNRWTHTCACVSLTLGNQVQGRLNSTPQVQSGSRAISSMLHPTPLLHPSCPPQGLQRGQAGAGLTWAGVESESRVQTTNSDSKVLYFFKIKITHCLETIYTRVTKNSCPGISIHRFVNYTHMVTSVLAKSSLEIYTRLWKCTPCSVTVYIQTRIDSMLHSLTSRQNAKYSSSVQNGGRVTLQGEALSRGRGRRNFCTSFLTITK